MATDADSNLSVPDLLLRLSELHAGSPTKASLQQPKLTFTERCRKLKTKAWNTLLSNMKGSHCFSSNLVGCDSIGDTADLYTWIYYLRLQRKYDDASRLEALIEQMPNLFNDAGLLKTVVRLFLKLANSEEKKSAPPIGHDTKVPVVIPKSENPVQIPDGPCLYGDTQQYAVEQWYMHYPRQLFEQPGISKTGTQVEEPLSLLQIFEAQPGSHLAGSGVFEGCTQNDYETTTQHSLYDALVHSSATSMDLKLDLPDLSDQNHAPEITVPKLQDGSDDEGFAETSSVVSPSSDHVTPGDSGFEAMPGNDDADSGDIWEKALTYVPCKHRVWENLGRPPQPTERPYISEYGPEVVTHLWTVHMDHLCLIDPNLRRPPIRQVTMETLVCDVINLLIGVPSQSFVYEPTHDSLCCVEGLHLAGMTPEGLVTACLDLTECGTYYRRLSEFSKPVVLDSFYHSGLIFQAFTGGIRKYLQHYRACVLSIKAGKTLMEINAIMQKVMQQMRFLSELCHCAKKRQTSEEQEEELEGEDLFPTGVSLLTYLYKETVDVAGSQFYPMMLSLLVSSCGPYLVFVQDWVFHGVCRDIYGEYMIQTNDEYLRYRDKHYWTEGYKMINQNTTDAVPLFLSDLANDIFVCGKSINLLKLCAPEHFLFTVDQIVPRVQLTFSMEEVAAIDETCRGYLGRMQQIARSQTLSRKQLAERAERAKKELMIQARQAAAHAVDRLRARALEQKKAEDAKKRLVFAELKDQMEQDLQRRAAVQQQQKEEDRALVEDANKQEILEATVSQQLEQQAREELIDYYSKLSAEAALRERRALWRVRRAELHNVRQEFLDTAEKEIQDELDGKLIQPNLVSDGNTVDLPMWAQKGLKTAAPAFGLDTSLEDMPEWARKGLKSADEDQDTILDLEFSQKDIGTPKTVAQEPQTQGNKVIVDGAELSKTEAINKFDEEEQKKHVSESVVGDIMRSEPSLKPDLEPSRFVGIVTEPKSVGQHPSASTIQELMYTEPAKVHTSGDEIEPTGQDKDSTEERLVPEGLQIEDITLEDISPSDASDLPSAQLDKAHFKTAPSQLTPKSQVKIVKGKHISVESIEESPSKSMIRLVDGASVLKESEEVVHKKTIKAVGEWHITQESSETDEMKHHIKLSDNMQATTQSSENEQKPHLKPVQGQHANIESVAQEQKTHLKMSADMHASKETVPVQIRPKQRSMFGHVSEVTQGQYDISVPKLKKFEGRHASKESDFYSYQVKPHRRRKVEQRCVAEEQTTEKEYRPGIKVDAKHHVSQESQDQDDLDERRLVKFKERNVKGHASDSTVQGLLYGGRFGKPQMVTEGTVTGQVTTTLSVWADSSIEPYEDAFNNLSDPPAVDLMSTMDDFLLADIENYGISSNPDISAHGFVSLPVLLKRSVTAPLITQISLVNQSIVNHFTSELHLDGHLKALRQFLLMRDGEFGQSLSDFLFEKLANSPLPNEMLNPVFLNNVLSKALRASMHGDSQYAENLAFALKYLPKVLKHNAPDALDCLDLTYKVEWPMNIVITTNSLTKYSRVFSFLLQLKRAVWVLKDVWHKLKRDALINRASTESQFRKLQLYRHEMQYFIRVMQEYVANQVIHVTWNEFKSDLSNKVHNLDDLHNCHGEYLNKLLSRCLLNQKAAPVMKILQDIFGLILKFRLQLTSHSWRRDPKTGSVKHPAFDNMCATYNSFNDFSRFLFKVVRKLAIKGYLPHLNELLLRLNFNHHYSVDT